MVVIKRFLLEKMERNFVFFWDIEVFEEGRVGG